MGRPLLTLGLLVCGGLLASVVGASPPAVVGTSLHPAPQSRMEGNQAVDDATAAALIGAISDQFSERNVEVKLDAVSIAPAGMIQREITGQGRLLLGTTDEWIPFRFKALYDTEQSSVGNPDLTLGDDAPGRSISVDSPMGKDLARQVGVRLHDEFADQPSQFAADSIRVTDQDSRYVRVEATGTADFASEGTTRAGVQGLYDSHRRQWLRLTYELGATANRAPAATVASR
jgi:hypothetical protein